VLEELHDPDEGLQDRNPAMLVDEQGDDDGAKTPEEGAEDPQVLNEWLEGFPRRRRRAPVPLHTSLLHRSARLEKIRKGFNPGGTIGRYG
jgi:hypothetical protein